MDICIDCSGDHGSAICVEGQLVDGACPYCGGHNITCFPEDAEER